MYVISSNQKLLQSLDAPIYGNMALRYARSGLGVGIDYRSVYSKVYNALYGIDGKSFFHIDTTLEKDVSLEKNTISLLSYAYRATGTNSVSADVQFSVTGANYSPTMAGYTLVTTGTGRESQKSISIRSVQKDGYSRVNFTLSSITQPYYTITSLSNQYVPVELTGMLTGASLPIILKNTEKTISYTGTSILPIFANTSVPAVLAGSGMILSASGNTIVRLPVQDFEIRFATGSTRVIEMTSNSGKLVWNGGFIL